MATRPPPTTLWRFTFFELWRVILLTTVVLVTVIAFAAAVKPLADGKLGPLDALRFMALATVPMMQYALPFAASFGATLAYHRMAQDNEIIAAHAGGVSHRALLGPAMVTGASLAIALSLLNEQVIPRFLRSMERLVSEDVARLMVSTIRAHETLRLNDMMVYADAIEPLGPDSDGRARERLLLSGVGLVNLDRDGRVVGEATASRATVWLYSVEPEDTPGGDGAAPETERDSTTYVRMTLQNVVPFIEGKLAPRLQEELTPRPWAVPNTFQDDPKFLTFGELRELRRRPEGMNFIDAHRRRLAFHLAERATIESIRASLAATGTFTLVDGRGQPITVRAGALRPPLPGEERWGLQPAEPGRPIEVEWLRKNLSDEGTDGPGPGGVQRYRAASAGLRPSSHDGAGDRRTTLTLVLDETSVSAPGASGAAGALTKREFASLTASDDPYPGLVAKSSQELLALARERIDAEPDPALAKPAKEFTTQLARLDREITGNQHGRVAMSLACLVMVVTGALTAMRLPGSMPLTVYLWSFFPALAALVTISAGQRVVHKMDEAGLVMLWSAVIGLGLYALGAYVSVKKH